MDHLRVGGELEQLRTLDVVRAVADGRLDFGIVREDALPAETKRWRLGSVGYPSKREAGSGSIAAKSSTSRTSLRPSLPRTRRCWSVRHR